LSLILQVVTERLVNGWLCARNFPGFCHLLEHVRGCSRAKPAGRLSLQPFGAEEADDQTRPGREPEHGLNADGVGQNAAEPRAAKHA
jgi:hypothetical protein